MSPSKTAVRAMLDELNARHQLSPLSAETIEVGKWLRALSAGEGPIVVPPDVEGNCEACGQRVQTYKRKIHATMAFTLIKLYRIHSQGIAWVNVRSIYTRGAAGDYAKLRFWGLVESMDSRTWQSNASGNWRLTPEGMNFVRHRHSVPMHALVYNNHCLGLQGEHVFISDCLGKEFNYAELMGSTPAEQASEA